MQRSYYGIECHILAKIDDKSCQSFYRKNQGDIGMKLKNNKFKQTLAQTRCRKYYQAVIPAFKYLMTEV